LQLFRQAIYAILIFAASYPSYRKFLPSPGAKFVFLSQTSELISLIGAGGALSLAISRYRWSKIAIRVSPVTVEIFLTPRSSL
jgi:hypothetical protein